jgi:protein phosphatase
MTLVLHYAARSDRGLVRDNNEDSVYAGARLLALADGMGGHAGGEVASQLTISALAPLDNDEPGENLLGKMEAAVAEGNRRIAVEVTAHPELDGMGTTLTALLFSGTRLGLAHIGDSRAYLLRGDELTQITHDDTFVQSLVDEGKITPEQAHTHPRRSLILRALTGHEITPAMSMREVRPKDRYMLCSDGLSDVISTETIAYTLAEGDADECADRLIELALRGGGPDNVTVIVADVIDVEYGQNAPIVAGAAGGVEDDSPPPDTSAGRAAAMKGPRQSRRPEFSSAPPVQKKHRTWPYVAVLVVIVLGIAGAFVGKNMLRSNYYVTLHDDQLAIAQGLSYQIFGIPLHHTYQTACISGTDTVEFHSSSELPTGCIPLQPKDFKPAAQAQLHASLPSGNLDSTQDQIKRMVQSDLLPLCASSASPPPDNQQSSSQTQTPYAQPDSTEQFATTTEPTPADPNTKQHQTSSSKPSPTPAEPGVTCREVHS